jgi:hypothetical protein
MTAAICRLCNAVLAETFVDLRMSPLCESYVSADRLDGQETFYPLHVRICTGRLLVQLTELCAGGRDLLGLRLLRLLLRLVRCVRQALRPHMIDQLALLATRSSSRCQQRRSPPAAFRRRRHPGRRCRVGCRRGRGGADERRARRGSGSRCGHGRQDRATLRVSRSGSREQPVRTRARYARLQCWTGGAGQADRAIFAEFCTFSADRMTPVRHDEPQALPVPIAADSHRYLGDRRRSCSRCRHPVNGSPPTGVALTVVDHQRRNPLVPSVILPGHRPLRARPGPPTVPRTALVRSTSGVAGRRAPARSGATRLRRRRPHS